MTGSLSFARVEPVAEVDTCRGKSTASASRLLPHDDRISRRRSEPVGFDQGRDEKLRVAKTRVGRTDRVHRMDTRWSLEAFKVCRAEGR